MNMAPILYGIYLSPPVRAVILCLETLEIEYQFKEIDLLNGEHLSPEFLKMNPQHTVPVLEDDGFILADSHTINAYLVDKYAEDKSLYPTDVKKRAIVNQRLHFDCDSLFARGLAISKPIVLEGAETVPPEKLKALQEAFDIVEKFLEGSEWIAGDQLTIADFSIITSITGWCYFVPLDESKYPKICEYVKRAEALPHYQGLCQSGKEEHHKLLRDYIPI